MSLKGRIGFVGLGAMGRLMINQLAAAADAGAVFGFDANAKAGADACAAAGATHCTSLNELAGQIDVLFTCLPNNEIVKEVYLGDGGIGSAARRGAVTIDCSTVGPEATVEVHDRLREQGIDHLDASMLGSTKQASEGTISFVVGGNAEALERVRSHLEVLGGMIRHCGPSGMGNRMKLLHQTMAAAHGVTTGETLALGEVLGIDMDLFYEIVTQGTGLAHSRFFEQRAPRIRSGDFSPMFMLKLMAKDVRLARTMLPDDVPQSALSGLESTVATLEAAENLGLGEEDFSAIAKVPMARLKAGSP
jgi:3-hydroxyisobutyrate dehydrogenase-like beta-hydroxyacid dehydrogenase